MPSQLTRPPNKTLTMTTAPEHRCRLQEVRSRLGTALLPSWPSSAYPRVCRAALRPPLEEVVAEPSQAAWPEVLRVLRAEALPWPSSAYPLVCRAALRPPLEEVVAEPSQAAWPE